MIKTLQTREEVITQYKYCDICGAEIKPALACSNAICEYCGKDLCEQCIGYEEETGADYRVMWCKRCWNIGICYRPKIEELHKEVEILYGEWREKCKRKEK